MSNYQIDRRQLMSELQFADPILKREADQVMHYFFDPSVEQLKKDFQNHPVTQEILGGIESSNISKTLEGKFREQQNKGDSQANLYSFIGFENSPEEVIAPILQRLDPRHVDGPKMKYTGRTKDKLEYTYEISAPNEEQIYNNTPFEGWADGLSWAKRIEQGVPGITHFLNEKNRPSSRSGGGIQIEGTLRTGRFRPVSYLSQIFNNFLRRIVGKVENGRTP